MNTKTITLSTGEDIVVHVVPPSVHDVVTKRHPLPTAPIIETATASGETLKMSIEDDPEYLAQKQVVETQRMAALQEAYTLFALKDVVVPEDFDITEEFGDELSYLDPDWKPREGKSGRKLDYIDYILLAGSADNLRVSEAINELVSIDQEVVDAIEASFQDDVSAEAD